jgi:transposase
VIAAVIKDVGIIDMLDARLVPDSPEEITPGEAVAGMMLNGLGFANRPFSLTPQFFASKPLDLLLHEGVHAAMFNRFTLGRTLDEVYTYGCDRLFSDLALAVCRREGIALRCNHLDTTSVCLTGAYVTDSDEPAMAITHGYSKDHRPDLKQAVLDLMVSQDGGVPLMSQSWDGNPSDTQIFQERAAALIETFQRSPTPRSLVADSKLYTEDHATNLQALGFLTRLPNTLKLVSQVITQALSADMWPRLDDTTRYDRVELCHDRMAPRWLVVSSQAAFERAEASVTKAQHRDYAAIEQPLLHLQAKRVETPEAAHAALAALEQGWRYHQVDAYALIEHKRDDHQRRPTSTTPIKAMAWQRQAQVRPDTETIEQQKQHNACFVLGTHIDVSQLPEADVMAAYNGQAQVEGGFRLLKDPRFFVSSLCVKKPSRLQGLLMVMTLALLVYAVAQRRLRQPLVRPHETLPTPIHQPTQRPTLRWAFPRLEGIHRVRVTVQGQVHDLLEGFTEVKLKVLRLCGEGVCRRYQISPA